MKDIEPADEDVLVICLNTTISHECNAERRSAVLYSCTFVDKFYRFSIFVLIVLLFQFRFSFRHFLVLVFVNEFVIFSFFTICVFVSENHTGLH